MHPLGRSGLLLCRDGKVISTFSSHDPMAGLAGTILYRVGGVARARCHWALNTCMVDERLISDVNAGVTR
jgi:hypothetical protein